MEVDTPDGTLTFEMKLCLPHYREESRESILESFAKIKKFYDKNKGKLLHKIEGDSPKEILEDLLEPFLEGNVFEDHRDYYQVILFRFNRYFKKLHEGTIEHMGNTEEDITYNRLFDQFRANLVNVVPLLCESTEIWYERTQLWEEKYSQNIN